MYPSAVLERIRIHITPTRKFAFLSAFVTGLLVHLYRLTNHLLTWDSVYNFYDSQNKVSHGRCFLTIGCGISSYYDIQWVIGLLSLLWLSLTCVCLTELFKIERKGLIFLTGALTVVFPSVAGTFAYMYTADGYFLAQLAATLAVLMTIKYRKGWMGGLILLAFSYGSYQAYVSYAVMLILCWFITRAYRSALSGEKDSDNSEIRLGHTIVNLILMGGLGTLLYFICNKLLVLLQHETMADYNGISTMSVPGPSQFVAACKNCLIDFTYFFFGPLDKGYFFKTINVLLFLTILCLILVAWIRLGASHIKQIGMMALCLVAMPFACFMIYFVSPDVQYYMLMNAGISIIYLLPILLYQELHFYDDAKNAFPGKWILSWACILTVCLHIFNFVLVDNISYLYMTTSNEKTFQLVSRMAGVMEQTSGYEHATKLAVIGHFDDYDTIDLNLPPAMAGVRDSIIISESTHFATMLDTYYGIHLQGLSKESLKPIQEQAAVQSMPCWPSQGSVSVIGDTVVIKVAN